VLLALVIPAYRPAVLPFLVAFILIAVSAMLVGDVPRYRYPVDPLMYVLAAGGLVGLASLAVSLARRERPRLPRSAFSPTTREPLAPPLPLDAGRPGGRGPAVRVGEGAGGWGPESRPRT
jgi:hypothetical protein